MALSNWATVAFDTDGKSCSGSFAVPSGNISASLFKNWLYIYAPQAWEHLDSIHCEPNIAEIQEGVITLGSLHINAARTDTQDAIFVQLSHGYEHNNTLTCMTGVACYGFISEFKWYLKHYPSLFEGIEVNKYHVSLVGGKVYDPTEGKDFDSYKAKDPKKADYWTLKYKDHVNAGYEKGDHYHEIHFYSTEETIKSIEVLIPKEYLIPEDDLWVGVTPELFEEFLIWLQNFDERLPEGYVDKLKRAQSFNQGDAFICGHLGLETPKSEVGGKQESPIILKAIDEPL